MAQKQVSGFARHFMFVYGEGFVTTPLAYVNLEIHDLNAVLDGDLPSDDKARIGCLKLGESVCLNPAKGSILSVIRTR